MKFLKLLLILSFLLPDRGFAAGYCPGMKTTKNLQEFLTSKNTAYKPEALAAMNIPLQEPNSLSRGFLKTFMGEKLEYLKASQAQIQEWQQCLSSKKTMNCKNPAENEIRAQFLSNDFQAALTSVRILRAFVYRPYTEDMIAPTRYWNPEDQLDLEQTAMSLGELAERPEPLKNYEREIAVKMYLDAWFDGIGPELIDYLAEEVTKGRDNKYEQREFELAFSAIQGAYAKSAQQIENQCSKQSDVEGCRQKSLREFIETTSFTTFPQSQNIVANLEKNVRLIYFERYKTLLSNFRLISFIKSAMPKYAEVYSAFSKMNEQAEKLKGELLKASKEAATAPNSSSEAFYISAGDMPLISDIVSAHPEYCAAAHTFTYLSKGADKQKRLITNVVFLVSMFTPGVVAMPLLLGVTGAMLLDANRIYQKEQKVFLSFASDNDSYSSGEFFYSAISEQAILWAGVPLMLAGGFSMPALKIKPLLKLKLKLRK